MNDIPFMGRIILVAILFSRYASGGLHLTSHPLYPGSGSALVKGQYEAEWSCQKEIQPMTLTAREGNELDRLLF